MDKSNTNSDKLFGNNNENIKTSERLPQVKILDLSIILYLHHCSEVVMKCTVNHWKRMIKWHHR